MDKNAIKKYAIWAREELIKRVSTKAEEYGIRDNVPIDEDIESIGDRVLTPIEKKQRTALVNIVKDKGFELAMEEAAYTWFNRFIALRFMEVNGYLPTRVRVFTDEENNFKPQILHEAIHMDLEGLNLEKVLDLKEQNKTDELYKYLIITQCNALHSVLPKMFPKIDDYTQLLFPDNILREGSAIEQMIAIIPEEDFKDAVQVLGWLYQYYNSVPKDTVFANLKKNIKITKENIPAATQLFTPDWIVRYMVENSLGRIAVDKFGVDPVSMEWKYYIPEAEQIEEVQNQLKIINSEKTSLEELKVIDPCMGSGHILVYAFDVLVQIYESQGYTARDAVASILENNLFGLDIDERAYQLAYFALMMKARSADRRFFSRKIEPQVYCPKGYADGEEYGSLLNVDELEEKPQGLKTNEQASLFDDNYELSLNTWNFRRLLNQKYDVVVTNPPYKGIGDVVEKIQSFAKEFYIDSYYDMSTMFMEKCVSMINDGGYYAMINIPVWMSLASYSKLRIKIIQNQCIVNLLHLGRGIFGSDYGSTAFVIAKRSMADYKGLYKKFFERQGDVESEDLKRIKFHAGTKDYLTQEALYEELPNNIIAYWATQSFVNAFSSGKNISSYATVFEGLKTRDKERFLRFWFEVDSPKWKRYAKGGAFRRWYGNNDYVVNWGTNGDEIRSFKKSSGSNFKHFFEPSVTYTAMTMSKFTGRYIDSQLFGGGGGGITDSAQIEYILGFVNTKVYDYIISAMKSTVNFEVGQIGKIPMLLRNPQEKSNVSNIAKMNVEISRNEWDSYEYSSDFVRHPLVNNLNIALSFGTWENKCINNFNQIKQNEEELNRIFIDIYGLQDELTPEVEDKDITVRLADKTRDIKSFISYAVGCMFGRYSLDVDGLAYAGGEFDNSKYTTFIPDKDNVIPICDDEYFEDDIVGRFIEFVKVVYGADTLEQNLDFIASALGGKGTSRDVIRAYFLNGFYADHCKIYQKRPIYWQLDSGKKNGFKALIYMHRYEADTMARVRTDYVHEQQGRYRTAIADLERRITDASTSERVKLTKQLTALKEQETEIRIFEEKIHHLADQMIRIDLDDGVKNNYAIFSDVLTKIK